MKISQSEMVKRLVKPGRVIRRELTDKDVELIHHVLGISGEAGELLDGIKKVVIYRKPIDLENVIEELGDLEFYMEGIRQTLGITRRETLEANKRKLGKRYPGFNYTNARAHARADKSDAPRKIVCRSSVRVLSKRAKSRSGVSH